MRAHVVLVLSIGVSLAAGRALFAEHSAPFPDLQGVWNGSTLTPLQRPLPFRNRSAFTPEEAAEYVRSSSDRLRGRLPTDVDRLMQIDIDADSVEVENMSAFGAAVQSGDLSALTQLLTSDVRVVTDGGGKVRSALNVIDGADRAARFLVDAARKRPGAWWREDFTTRFAMINGLPGIIVEAPEGPVQTAAFEIDGDVIRALYVVRNPDKLRHLAAPASSSHDIGRG